LLLLASEFTFETMTSSNRPFYFCSLVLFPALLLALSAPVAAADFNDVSTDHWAYKAIDALANRYNVMTGFPDGTFGGEKGVSRYELAAALLKILDRHTPMIADQAPNANQARRLIEDDKLLDKLKEEFRQEVVLERSHLNGLTSRVGAAEALLKTLTPAVQKQKVSLEGSLNNSWADDTLDVGKDRTAPYIKSALALTLKGEFQPGYEFKGVISSKVRPNGSGIIPGTLGDRTKDTDDNYRPLFLNEARIDAKLNPLSTLHMGYFKSFTANLGATSILPFKTGDFDMGQGALGAATGPDLPVGGRDVHMVLEQSLGPSTLIAGINSNNTMGTINAKFAPFAISASYDFQNIAISQTLFPNGPRVKTNDNLALVLDFDKESYGATAHVQMRNLDFLQSGLALRGVLYGIEGNILTYIHTEPSKSATVARYGGLLSIPNYPLPWFKMQTPSMILAALDNYTVLAPNRGDGRPSVGPGGQILGDNAGISVLMNIPNPIIPNLTFEYVAQAKLIESILLGNESDPLQSETLQLKSSISF
jgi:hypothetical protein